MAHLTQLLRGWLVMGCDGCDGSLFGCLVAAGLVSAVGGFGCGCASACGCGLAVDVTESRSKQSASSQTFDIRKRSSHAQAELVDIPVDAVGIYRQVLNMHKESGQPLSLGSINERCWSFWPRVEVLTRIPAAS